MVFPGVFDYQLRQREYLLKIAQAISGRLDLPGVLSMVIQYAVEMLRGRAGLIALRRQDDTFAFVASYRVDQRLLPHFAPLLGGIPLTPGRVSTTRWFIPRLRHKVSLVDQVVGMGLEQVIALPLVVREQIIGVIYAFRSPGAALFSEVDEEILAGFANQAAIAIENARLYSEMADQAMEMTQLYESALLLATTRDLEGVVQALAERARILTGAQWGQVQLYDRATASLTRGTCAGAEAAYLGGLDPIVQEAIAQREPVVVANVQHDPRTHGEAAAGVGSYLAVPAVDEDGPVAVLTVGRSGAGSFGQHHVRLLSTFAHLAAIAIQRARLFQAIAEEKQRLDAVIQGSADGILITDAQGKVQTANPSLERMTGQKTDEMAGQSWDRILTLTNNHGTSIPLVSPSPQQQTPWSVEGYLKRRDGQRGPFVYVSASPLHDSEGHLTSVVANVVDITRLKEAEEAKSAFLAGMSHELKTPLALIRGYAETLSRTDVAWDEETLQESLAVIKDEADHLTDLVNNLLDSARIEAGGLSLHLSQTRLDRLAERLVAEFQTLDREHMWTVGFPSDFPAVRADPERIRQVLHNLLSNAVKYSPKGGLIRVTGWVEEDRIGVSVSDEGPGIPFDQQQRIFERFYRSQGQRTRRTEGAGLGLYMARAIVEGHGGRIWVESMPEKGTTFYFTIPREKQ